MLSAASLVPGPKLPSDWVVDTEGDGVIGREAIGLAKRAQGILKKGSPDWLRAADIIMIAEDAHKKQQR